MHYTAYIEFIYSGDPEGNIFGKVDPNYFVNWSTFHRYNAAWYFSVNTGTSLGACPYMPVTTFERGWTLFYGMYSMALFAYAIGSLTLLLVKDTDLTGEYHSKLENLMRLVDPLALEIEVCNLIGCVDGAVGAFERGAG